jgi:hypothetical protein
VTQTLSFLNTILKKTDDEGQHHEDELQSVHTLQPVQEVHRLQPVHLERIR